MPLPADYSIVQIDSLPRLLDLVAVIRRDDTEMDIDRLGPYLEQWDDVYIGVVYHKRKPVGYAAWVQFDTRVLLDSIMVLKQHRNRGLGFHLMSAGFEHFGDVFYTLKVNNPAARRFYLRHGWRVLGVGYDVLGFNEDVEFLGKGTQQ